MSQHRFPRSSNVVATYHYRASVYRWYIRGMAGISWYFQFPNFETNFHWPYLVGPPAYDLLYRPTRLPTALVLIMISPQLSEINYTSHYFFSIQLGWLGNSIRSSVASSPLFVGNGSREDGYPKFAAFIAPSIAPPLGFPQCQGASIQPLNAAAAGWPALPS